MIRRAPVNSRRGAPEHHGRADSDAVALWSADARLYSEATLAVGSTGDRVPEPPVDELVVVVPVSFHAPLPKVSPRSTLPSGSSNPSKRAMK